MKRALLRRPSPAMGVALISLFVSLGGVSYGLATGSIDSREIKNNTIRSKDVRNNAVHGSTDLRNNSVRGRDIRNQTITGGDVNEPTLGKVPLASRADSAGLATNALNAANASQVGGTGVTKVNYVEASGTAPKTIFRNRGLTLTGTCPAGTPTITARTTKQNASIYTAFADTDNDHQVYSDDLENGDFTTATSFDLLGGGDGDPGLITFTYRAPDRAFVTGTIVVDRNPLTPTRCEAFGTVFSG